MNELPDSGDLSRSYVLCRLHVFFPEIFLLNNLNTLVCYVAEINNYLYHLHDSIFNNWLKHFGV